MLGWFGGYGFTGTMGFFTNVMHIPALFAFLAIAAEFYGGLGLILGFLTRIAALGSLPICCGHRLGSLSVRFLHELDRSTEGRRLRMSPARARTHCRGFMLTGARGHSTLPHYFLNLKVSKILLNVCA
jgi:DoxX-like protein